MIIEGTTPQYPKPCNQCVHGPHDPEKALSCVCWTCSSHIKWFMFKPKQEDTNQS